MPTLPQSLLESNEDKAIWAAKEGEIVKAAIYCRVSTNSQEAEGTSLDSQREICLEKAKGLGYTVPDNYIFMETHSGLTLKRPQLTELRALVGSSVVGAVVALKPDRLSRRGEDTLLLAEEIKNAKVKLVLVLDQWDDTLPGKAVAFMQGWAGEVYVANMLEATMRAKAKLLAQGIMPQGTGLGLYGYKWDTQNKKRVPLEFEVKIVRKVFEMRANGMKPLAIASELNKQGILTKTGSKWHGTVIRRMLENEAYIGKTYFGKHRGGKRETRVKLPQSEWKLLKNTTPAIVSEDLFSRAQQLMAEAKAWHGTHNKHQYLLRGHIVCGHCGKNMLGSGWYKGIEYRYRYYRCGGTNANAEKIQTCNAPQIPADRLETIVWDNIRKTLEKPEVVLAEVKRQLEYKQEDTNTQAVAEAIKQIKHRLNSYATQEKQLLKLFRYGEITEDVILDEINQLKQERETDKKQLADLTSTKTKLVDLDKAEAGVGEFCAIARKALANVSFEDKCLALDMLGIKVTATKDNIEVKGFLPSEAESWCLGTNIPMSVQW